MAQTAPAGEAIASAPRGAFLRARAEHARDAAEHDAIAFRENTR